MTKTLLKENNLPNIIDNLNFYFFRRNLMKFGIQGLLTNHDSWLLFKLAMQSSPNGHIVEIGSFKGLSTVILANVARLKGLKKIIAIDPHAGYPNGKDNKIIDTWPIFNDNLNKFNLLPYVDIRKEYSFETSKQWNLPISLLWIDGDHSYDAVKQDFELFSPYLISNGIIAFHDAGTKYFLPGPSKLIKEIESSNQFSPFQFIQGMAWARKV